jgi:hypothetical protein
MTQQKPTQQSKTEPVRMLIAHPAPYGTVTASARLAYDLAARLRAALAAAGFEVERDFPHLRGDTTMSDEPFLTLGRLRLGVVERLVAAFLKFCADNPEAKS